MQRRLLEKEGMLIWRWLQDVPYTDPVERRLAPLLQLMIIAVAAVLVVILFIAIFWMGLSGLPAEGVVLVVLFWAALGIMLVLLRRGYFRLTAWLLLGLIFASAARRLVLADAGSADEALIVYFLPLIIAGLFLGRGGLVFVLLATCLLLLIPAHIQKLGSDTAITFIFNFVLISFLLDLFSITLRAELTTALVRNEELEQAHQALKNSTAELFKLNERLNVTLISIGDGVLVTDAQGRITFINPVAARLTGWEEAEAIGQEISQIFRIVNEETRQSVSIPIMEAIQKGTIVGLANHTLLLSRTGAEWPISDSGAPIRDTTGAIIGAVLVFRDGSEQREYERALEASEARYRQLVDNATDVIYTLDLEGRFTSINPAAEQLTGYSVEELLNMALRDLVVPDELQRSEQMRERKLSGESRTVYELEVITRNQQRRILEVNSQLTGDRLAPTGIEGIARDITTRKEIERRIRTLHHISAALAKSITLQEVVSVIIDQGLTALGAHHGAVGLVSGDRRSLELIGLATFSEDDFESYQYTSLDVRGPMTDSIRTGTPVWIESQVQYLEQYPHYGGVVRDITKTQAAAALPLRIRSQIIGSLMVSFPERRTFPDDERGFLETLADYCAQSIERAQLYESTQQGREILQVRVYQQSVIADLGQQALTSHDLGTLMAGTAAVIAKTLNLEFVKILELVRNENHLLLKAGIGWKEGYVGQATEGTDIHSPAGYTLKASEPVIVEDLRTETRFSDPPLLHDHGVISGMSVIIQGHEGPYGVLGVYTTQRRTFSHDDIYFIQSIANVLGAAIENTRLSEQAGAAAALEERQRLARELHDSVTQSLFVATSRAEMLPRLWERDPGAAMEHLREVITINRGAMAEMRGLLLELRPEAILNNSLDNLYRQLLDAAPARGEIEGELIVADSSEPLPLPPDVHLAFYRIAQESVNNVIKHSNASILRIELTYTADEVWVRIVDNGRGFDPNRNQQGIGLGSMRERAEAIGANLEVTSKQNQGTIVVLHWASPEIS